MHRKSSKGNASRKWFEDSDKDPGIYLLSSVDNVLNTNGKEEPCTHASQNVYRHDNH